VTYLRHGPIFKHKFAANLLPSPSAKKFENWLISAEVIGKSLVPLFFLTHSVYTTGGLVAEWLACWTQAQKGPGSNRSRDAVG